MANAALFIGYGSVMPGRAQQALQVFNEALQYYGRLQQHGQLESFEPVFLEPHGGDLAGFILLRGDREQLNTIRYTAEFTRLTNRASLVVQHIGIVSGFTGDEQNRLFQDLQTQATDLG